ncbi:MAG: restriction endonuclease [Methanobrevibacter sp.]|jgi:hypothetical protein|nr:restriction endonuclease [Candidatus Methanovirga aequatorialis]
MEKSRLVNFIGTMMEKSGFKVYKNFKTSDMIVDIYGVLPTLIGDFGVVVACKNYDKQWNVGLEILKDMEMVGRRLKASRVAIVTSSSFSSQAVNYATRKNIKLIDRDDLIKFAKKFSEENKELNDESTSLSNVDNGSNLELNNFSDFNPRDTFLRKINKTPYNKKKITLSKPRSSSNTRDKKKLSSIFSKNNGQSLEHLPQDTFNNSPKKEKLSYGMILRAILNNIVVMIVTVVLLSYTISYALEKLGVLSGGRTTGVSKMLLSLILSYGLVLLLNKNKAVWIVKGTIVFFISVAILIILIIL